jgi:PhzF family phenazine biosynthesis protein
MALTPDHTALKALGQKVGVAALSAPADKENPVTALIARSSREARAFERATQTHAPAAPEPDLWVRAFAAPVGVAEDPVTGSLNASLAQWLMADGVLPTRYQATQGQALGRDGQVFLSRDAQAQVWVGGDVVCCISGEVQL